jgi:hypothetical protein
MAEIINCSYKVIDSLLEISLDDVEIEDNSSYEIRLKGFKSLDGDAVLEDTNLKVITELTPSYCRVSDVAILVDTFEIPESTILYYIREASKYVDYIMSSNSLSKTTEVTFPMREFLTVKVMIDCLLKAYINKAAGSGIKGKLGEISFENTEKYATSIDDLLDDLWRQLKKWEDALKGYEFEGRVAPAYSVKASTATSNTSVQSIASAIDRELPIL